MTDPHEVDRAAGVFALPRRTVVIAVSAIVILGVLGVILVAVRSQPPSGTEPASSITVNGKALVHVGAFPWADAVWQDTAHTTLTVEAQLDQVQILPGAFGCNDAEPRVRVVRSKSSVSVVVDAYYPPPPITGTANLGCSDVGLGTRAMTVHLGQALSGRTLLDGTTAAHHAVLDPTTVPVPTALPDGFLLRRTTWDERTGVATKVWATDTPKKGSYEDYTVTVGRAGGLTKGPGREVGRTTVRGRAATVFLYGNGGGYDWSQSIHWTVGDGRAIVLTAHGNTGNHPALAEIERVAQSIPAA